MVSLSEIFLNLFGSLFTKPLVQNTGPVPQAFNIIQDPKQTLALPAFFERIRQTEVVKPFLLNQIAEANQFLKQTFKAPILPKGLVTGGKQLKCRGPNCLGIFQAAGTVTSFDPFTGQRIAIAGSPQFQQITGTNFAFNQARISQGSFIQFSVQSFINDLRARISIIDTNSV